MRVSTAEAKRRFSELIARAAFGKEKVIITKRGRPLAALVPLDRPGPHLAEAKGWLEANDPFFGIMAGIVRQRARHRPRILRRR